MMRNLVLAADERLAERPFTDPEHSQEDLATMRHMARQLVASYDASGRRDFVPGKQGALRLIDAQGRAFKIYYIRPKQLFSLRDLAVVGFFGHRRPKANIEPLSRADQEFERQFLRHPELLSLSTVRLPSGNFGNLVLFSEPEAIDRWNYSQPHRDLVAKVSPPYYESVRLNNGVLTEGLASPDDLRLLRVKYLDYRSDPPWRAVRILETSQF